MTDQPLSLGHDAERANRAPHSARSDRPRGGVGFRFRRVALRAALLVFCVSLVSCSGYRNYREAQLAELNNDWDAAVLHYLELTRLDPSNLRYKASLMRAKIAAANQHFDRAKDFHEADLLGQALVELQKAVTLDPTNQYAKAELDKVTEEIEALEQGETRENLEEMKERTQGARAEPPVLNPRSPEPIDLSFPEAQSVKQIYQALGKAFGINVLFDPKLRDTEIAIELKNVTAQDALEILMRTAGHFYKTLDEQSIIVVADTPQNRRTYEDLIIQTFFLSNSDVKEVMNQLRSLVDSRKIATNEALNAIILRDTADKVKVAERIIQANDKAKAEVVVDVELLQLNTNKLQDLGLSLSASSIGVSLDNGGEGVPLRFNDLEFLNGNDWVLSIPNFAFDFIKESSDAQTLAKPQLRISEGEQARLRIGDRVPIPVTSFNTANTVGSNVVPITSFQYQDVGILIEIEPRVHHNDEVSLTVSIEVSNIASFVGDQPVIGSRNIETTIRLQDGETNMLAGLIRTDESNSDEGIPGLSDIPLLGRLFSKKRTQNQRTDIVLTLTPHIVRRASITEDDLKPIWVGTEQNITFRGGSPSVESANEGPFDEDEASSDAEEMRQRLQRLPRGLRPPADDGSDEGADDSGQEADEEEQPSGRELVPSVRRNPLDRDPPRNLSDAGVEALRPQPSHVPSGIWPLTSGLAAQFEAASLVALEGAAPGPSALRAELQAPAAVRSGERFQVRLMVDGAPALAHLPSRLRFDSDRLELESVEAGSWFGGPAVQVLHSGAESGEVVLGMSRLRQATSLVGSTGDVAVLTFRARPGFVGQAAVELLDLNPLAEGLVPIRLNGDSSVVEFVVRPAQDVRPVRPEVP